MATVALGVSALYVHFALSLLVWTVVPLVAGLRPVVIVSGSMTPVIEAGDVVLVSRRPAAVKTGSVVVFDDPAQPGRWVTHRVVSRDNEGTLRTKGDANALADSTPVRADAVQGLGRFVVPGVGAPLVWLRNGEWPLAVVWATGTALALAVVGRGLRRPARWSTPAARTPAPNPVPQPARVAGTLPWWEPAQPPRRHGTPRWAVVAVAAVVAVGIAVPRVMTAQAAFADAAGNPGNEFVAATSFCADPGAQMLTPNADAKVEQNSPAANYGATADLAMDPRTNRAVRTLVSFTLPANPAGCVMSATLRVYATTAVAGRTLQAWSAGGAWTEGAVTWNTQPAAAGTPAAVASPAGPGWIEFAVTDLVAAHYAGSNNGFVLKDATESGGANLGQMLSSRSGANPPQLVLNFSGTPGRPAAPSALDAIAASAGRINLTWTDNSTSETGFVVERSLNPTTGWAPVASLGADITSHGDAGLTPLTTYYYRVRATNAAGNSAASDVASATTLTLPSSAPAAPTDLAITSTDVNSVTLSWTDNASSEDMFVIDRSPAGAGTWTQAGTVDPDVTTFVSAGLSGGTAYDHRVRAVNAAGASAWSNVVTGTTAACSTLPPQTLSAVSDAAVMQAYATYAIGDLAPASLFTRSHTADNARALVRFDSPSVPLGCVVASATLRLNVTSQTSARTLQVLRADAAWAEATVTWNTQPPAAGVAVTAGTAVGWLPVTVTDHVTAQVSGANHGFVIRDAAEESGGTTDVNLTSKEGGTASELVVTLGP